MLETTSEPAPAILPEFIADSLFSNTITLELNSKQVNHIVNSNLVYSLEVDQQINLAEDSKNAVVTKELRDNTQTIPWGIHSTGAYLVNSFEQSGDKIKVAVFDTGISEHSDLSIAGGISFADETIGYADNNGHGTHIAGIIAALNNTIGVVGFSNNIELYSVRVLDNSGKGNVSSVIEGIEWAIHNDIDIINMSFVFNDYSEMLHEAIQAATENNIIIVAAAGNGGLGDNTVQFPARYTEVVSVGAVDSYHNRSNFSATGQDLDLMAPGFNILSTALGDMYSTYSGTSQASAHVTGAMALLWSSNSNLTAIEIEELILDTATELGPSEQYGKGIVNVAKAKGIISGAIAPIGNSLDNGGEELFVPKLKLDSDIEIASFDKYGDSMMYEPGELAKVGLKLEGDLNGQNPHEQIIIELYEASSPSNILKTEVINNPQLNKNYEFSWQIPLNTAIGQYHIRYRYPAYPDGSWDDVFVIIVMQSGLGPDTYEPNDTFTTAYPVSENRTYISYISTVIDNDYYKFTAPKNGQIDISLKVPSDKNYDLQVYDENGYIIEYDPTGIGEDENLTISINEGKVYYMRVFGYYGDYGIEPYTLTLSKVNETLYPAPTGLIATAIGDSIKITWNAMPEAIEYLVQLDGEFLAVSDTNTYTIYDLDPVRTYTIGVAAVYADENSLFTTVKIMTSIPELYVNQTRDIISSTERLFKFTPPTTGIYKIYTSSYLSTTSDTVINVYSDASLTRLLYSNDDNLDSTFSSVQMNLTAGNTYYVKLSWFDIGEQSASITAVTVQSSMPYIELDEYVDIDERLLDSSTVYVFIPTRSGHYKIFTDFYGGVATAKENDTIIEVFSDFNMTRAIAGGTNDDIRDSLFSEVNIALTQNVPYYIRVKEASGSGVYAQLQVTTSDDAAYIPLSENQTYDIALEQNQQGFYKFTANYSGQYRIFTSGITGQPLADTVVEIYSDPQLMNLIGMNDDVVGQAHYGTSYSKVDLTLDANSTYYIVVKSYDPRKPIKTRVTIEETVNRTKDDAIVIDWGELVTTDSRGESLKISSLYDVDYYFIELLEPSQVYVSTSDGMGAIENLNGNILGYFSKGGDSVFNLPAGSFYIKVQDNMFGSTSSKKLPYEYELTVEINDIEISNENNELLQRMHVNNSDNKILVPTPGESTIQSVKWNYKNKKNTVKLRIEISAKTTTSERLVYSKEIAGSKRAGEITVISWSGSVNENTDYALQYSTQFGKYYYAKDGEYNIYVYEYTTSSKRDISQVALIQVRNNPLDKASWVPLPPKKGRIDGKYTDITSNNKHKSQEARDYYFRNIMPSYQEIPETGFNRWSQEIYGKNGIENFWHYSSLVVYNPNQSLVQNVQTMLDITGLIPVIGEGADAINGTIYLIRGDNANAILSLASMIPVLGNVSGGGRVVKLMRVEHVLESCMALDCMKEAYKNINNYYKQGSKDLAKELAKVVKIPDLAPGIKEWQAHHIIPQGGKNEFFRKLQAKLADPKIDIDLNSAANGVWLPVKPKTEYGAVDKFLIVNTDTYVEWTVTAHKKHSKSYGEFLWEMMEGVTTREDALHVIDEVRNLLLSGEITLANTKR